jgi:hypothetical protein
MLDERFRMMCLAEGLSGRFKMYLSDDGRGEIVEALNKFLADSLFEVRESPL